MGVVYPIANECVYSSIDHIRSKIKRDWFLFMSIESFASSEVWVLDKRHPERSEHTDHPLKQVISTEL